MKIYLFLTFPIQSVGGGQCYVAGKAKYLESQGWKVFVFSCGNPRSERPCPIDYLNKYKSFMIYDLNRPVFEMSKWHVRNVISNVVKMIGVGQDDEIIIESHDDKTSLWGELIASKIGAKHIFLTANELYRKPNQCYEKKIKFYEFKFNRGEILCSYKTISNLFEGYRTFKENEIKETFINEDPVQDLHNQIIEDINKKDFNICYIGRSGKPYFPNIVKGVEEFSSLHKNKTIQFILVSDIAKDQYDKIEDISVNNDNLTIVMLGTLHPLPRSLFTKIDVVIAGSGSARCSVEEGAITIAADPKSKMALGILGYDTNESVYRIKDSVVTSFSEALERVLVKKVHLTMTYKYPSKRGVAECTKHNFELIRRSSHKKEYYDERLLLEGKKNYLMMLRIIIREAINSFRK